MTEHEDEGSCGFDVEVTRHPIRYIKDEKRRRELLPQEEQRAINYIKENTNHEST